MNYIKYLLGKCYNAKSYKWIIFIFGVGLYAFTFFVPLFQYGYGFDTQYLSYTALFYPCFNFIINHKEILVSGVYDKVLKIFIYDYIFAISNIFINILVYKSAFKKNKIKLWNFLPYLIPIIFIIIAAIYLSTQNPKGFIVLNYGFYLYFVLVGLFYLFCWSSERYKAFPKPTSRLHKPTTNERIAQLEKQLEALKNNNSKTE